jgi:two-component system sensor histidine kinase KdpD
MSSVRLFPYLAAAAAVAALTLIAHAVTRVVALPHVSILFLAAVVMSAALWGLGPALLAAVLSVASGAYFFYSPILSLRVAGEQDLADLAVFIVVAALTSRLADRVRAKALEAEAQQHKLASLLAFSEHLAAATSESEAQAAIVQHLSAVLGGPVTVVMAGDPEAAHEGRRLALIAEHGPVAAITAPASATGIDPEFEKALLAQAAHALERTRLRREVAEARLKVQGEALREALINSVSHDLQTPLAAILGSATALESFGDPGDATRRELVATIREETERLAAYIENVLDLTRIRAGQIAPRLELVDLSDIIDAALRRKQKALGGHRVRVELPPDLPMLKLDLFLMEHALANVLDNAAKYAPAGSEVSLVAAARDGQVVLDITDQGSGIPPGEHDRIFEPFYRGAGPGGRPASGTGLGLAICRAFIAANGGTVSVLAGAAPCGTTLRVTLPVPETAAATEASDD